MDSAAIGPASDVFALEIAEWIARHQLLGGSDPFQSVRIEPGELDHLPGEKTVYLRWGELENGLAGLLSGMTRVALEYSPRNAIPYVAKVDAGTCVQLDQYETDSPETSHVGRTRPRHQIGGSDRAPANSEKPASADRVCRIIPPA